MKKIMFIFLFLIFSLSLNFVYAQDIEIIGPDKPVTVYTNKINELDILIKNNRNVNDVVYFSIWPTQWISLDKYWSRLGGGETISLSLNINPPFDAEEGTSIFSITVKSVDYNVTASKQLYVLVKRSSPIFLTDIKLNKQSFKPSETLIIQPVLTNIDKNEKVDVFVTTKILQNDLLIQEFDDSVSVDSLKILTLSHNFDIKLTHKPGDYKIVVDVRDNLNKILDEKSTIFKIETISHRIIEEKETKRNLFDSSITIKITNNGNVPEYNFNFSVILPLVTKSFFYPKIEPNFQEEKNGRIIYKWLIRELDPGETITINYELKFTNIVIISCILVIVIIWVVWLTFQPKLMKKYMGVLAKDEEVTISLHVKNKGRKTLDSVTVKDFVPAIATVIKEFDTLTPSITRKTTGTELTWQVKDIRPKEERVLTYKIKPVIELLGDLKLPKAHLLYETKKGKKRRALSKMITIMRKVK